MSELADHLRKDLKLLSSDSLFIISLIMLAVIAFIMAFEASWAYVDSSWSYYSVLTTRSIIERRQVNTLEDYWTNLCNMYSVLLFIVASMLLTSEKESGMVSFILTLKTRKWQFYLSKFLMLTGVAAFTVTASMLAYLIVFSSMDVPFLGIVDVLSSMLFPFLVIMTFCSIGLMASALVKKKGAAIALAVVLYLVITMVYASATSMGESIAYDDPDFDYSEDDFVDFVPLGYKILIYANPWVLINGRADYLGTWEGAALGLCMIAFFLVLGSVLFARERTERGLFKDLIGRTRRSEGGVSKK
jgi:ABC-type transport system involved in multi-copper enzyme maturation permease subunit